MASPYVVDTLLDDSSASLTSFPINKPVGSSNDQQIFFTIVGDNMGSFTPVEAIAEIKTPDVDIGGTALMQTYHKKMLGGDPSFYTIDSDVSERAVWAVYAIAGFGSIDSVSTIVTGTGTSAAIPSITPTVDECLLITVVGCDGTSATHSTISTWGNLIYRELSSGGSVSMQALAQTTAATVSGNTVTWANSRPYAAYVIAIAPPSADEHELAITNMEITVVLDGASIGQTHNITLAELVNQIMLGDLNFQQNHLLSITNLESTVEIQSSELHEVYNLDVDDIEVLVALNEATIGQTHTLNLNDLETTVLIDVLNLIQKHQLTLEDLSSLITIDSTLLSEIHALLLNDISSAIDITMPSIGQKHLFLIQDIDLQITFDAISLIQSHVLNLLSINIDIDIEESALAQTHNLSVEDIESLINLSVIYFVLGDELFIDDLELSTIIDSALLGQTHNILADNLLATILLDAAAIGQKHNLTVSEILSLITIDGATLGQSHTLTTDDFDLEFILGVITTVVGTILTINDMELSIIIDDINFIQQHNLVLNDLTIITSIDSSVVDYIASFTEPNVLLSRLFSCHDAPIMVFSSHVPGLATLNIDDKMIAKLVGNTDNQYILLTQIRDGKPYFYLYDLENQTYA